MDFNAALIEALRVSTSGPRRSPTLAPPASRFIGRAADLVALAAIFGEGGRLVTLWGPAGMGKTRLSLEVARAWADAHPGDAAWVSELAEARSLEAVCGVVSRAIRAPIAAAEDEAEMIERIARVLASQGPALLVLDNLEQVVREAAPALDRWVREAPLVRFLVTSRERTRLPGEVSYELSPLALPEEDGASLDAEAAELFLDRARAAAPLAATSSRAPGIGKGDGAKVAALVRALEGIPLAIELAAARYDVLGLDGLLARLPRRLELLAGGWRGVDARQATLRSAIEWSWDLLDEPERRALARCSVFRGGFTLEAADAVLAEPGASALDLVQSLRDKSLLRASPAAAGPVRFSLYEGVREFAAEKLAALGERAPAEERHAAHYLAAGEAAALEIDRSGAIDALNRLADDAENLLAVATGSLDPARISRGSVERAARALSAVDPVLSTRGPFGAHLDLLDRALAAGERLGMDPLLEAGTLAARGRARRLRGLGDAGLADLEQARARARDLGATRLEAGILVDLGVLHHDRRAMDRATTHYGEALALHRAIGDLRAEARVLGNLGALHHDERRFDEALRHYEEALAIAGSIGDLRLLGIISTNAGVFEQERGAPAHARRRFERAVGALDEFGDVRLLAITLGNLGMLHHEEGRLDDARACDERAVALLQEVGDRNSEALARGRLGAVLASLDRLDDAARALDRSERSLAHLGDELRLELVRLAWGFLEVARARLARREKRASAAAEHLAEARARVARVRAGDPSLADRSDDIRLSLRILERTLAAMGEAGAPAASDLLLSPEARWCRPPGSGTWHDLRERIAVRRILVKLVEHQREAPGRGLSLGELQEIGWPGERILPEAASNRIYVTMNQLRKLGLKEWLTRGEGGYLLDPALPVHYVAIEPSEG